ncbi:MAG: hypothetical protein R2876_02785 [Eubacteriales bacterium]
MIRMLYGKKGSGKSKKIVDMANESVKTAKGVSVFIDDDNRLMYDLKRDIRFVDTTEYGIDSLDRLYGLICGMMSQNYDLECVFIDGLNNIVKEDIAEMKDFFKNLDKVTEANNVDVVMIISADAKDMPKFLTKYENII